jgi:hypothetical protein
MAHISPGELRKNIEEATKPVTIGGIYVHYKSPDKPYKVLAIGLQEATEEPCVVYKAQYGEGITWARNLSDWLTQVKNEQGEIIPRFREISKDTIK